MRFIKLFPIKYFWMTIYFIKKKILYNLLYKKNYSDKMLRFSGAEMSRFWVVSVLNCPDAQSAVLSCHSPPHPERTSTTISIKKNHFPEIHQL